MSSESIDLGKIVDEYMSDEPLVLSGKTFHVNGVLTIQRNISIEFPPDSSLTCDSIHIVQCSNVSLINITAKTSIKIGMSHVSLTNCNFDGLPKNEDYFVEGRFFSKVVINQCKFLNSNTFGILVEAGTEMFTNDCQFSHVKLNAVILCPDCVISIKDCQFAESDEFFIKCSHNSGCFIKDSTFDGSEAGAIATFGEVSITNSTIKNCKLGIDGEANCIVSVSDCFFDTIEHSSLVIINGKITATNSMFQNITGNALNSMCSIAEVIGCTMKDTVYPFISISQNSKAIIKNSTFDHTSSSCIIIRKGSQATIEDCTFSNTSRFGLALCNANTIVCNNCVFNKCKFAMIACFDISDLCVKDSHLNGPSEVGIDVFCGGKVNAEKTTIKGSTIAAIRNRYGGIVYIIDSTIEAGQEMINTGSSFRSKNIENFEDIDQTFLPESPIPKCMTCGKPCDSMYSDCAHSVKCRECAQFPGECELCHLQYTKIISPIDSSPEGNKTCVICLTKQADAIMIPCGHLVCTECADEWWKSSCLCPICRNPNSYCRKLMPYV